jgi:hypothetical protein
MGRAAETYELGVDVKTLYWIGRGLCGSRRSLYTLAGVGFLAVGLPVAASVQIPLNVKIPQHGDNRFARFTEQRIREMTT